MAVVDLNTNEYIDVQSGLLNLFGNDQGRVRKAGEYNVLADGRHCVTAYIALASLPTAASGNEQIIDDTVTIPAGAFIEQVDVLVVKEPTTGGSPNLDLGLVDQDRSTEIDFNGFIAAGDGWETGTDLGTLFTYVKGTTEAGALIGTKLTNTGLITASADTADWTAGVIQVRIYFSMHPAHAY
jgi:hypothetical protein